jgi:hypothetical protein
MRLRLNLALALCLLAATSQPLAAQSLHDYVAWLAMMSTPYGALPPLVTRAMAGPAAGVTGGRSFDLQYGHFSFGEGSDAVNTGGVGARFGRLGVLVGYEGCSGCDGALLVDADYEAVLVRQTLTGDGTNSLFTIGLRPEVGLGRSLTDGSASASTTISATLDLPIAVSVPVGKTAKMVPFMSPGFGVGAVRAGDDSDSGTRASLGFGAGLVDLSPGMSLTVSWRKIFLKDAPMTIGIGLSFDR